MRVSIRGGVGWGPVLDSANGKFLIYQRYFLVRYVKYLILCGNALMVFMEFFDFSGWKILQAMQFISVVFFLWPPNLFYGVFGRRLI
jgi:hypothetical protein